MLEARAKHLGVDGSMIFHNRFVNQTNRRSFSAADIYITPYLNAEQITSGTLAYAVGAGKRSSPHRTSMRASCWPTGAGVSAMEGFGRHRARSRRRAGSDPVRYRTMCARAAEHGREMTWPAVARQYVETFSRALANETHRRRASFQAQTLASRPAGWPEIDLRHVRTLTDDTGILQHARSSIPRYEDGMPGRQRASPAVDDAPRGGGHRRPCGSARWPHATWDS